MATIPENQLEISSSIGTSGYVRVVGTDGKSYRVAIATLVADGITTDTTLSEAGVAADAEAVGDAIEDIIGLSDAAKTALLNCFQNVAWINENGQTYYNALYDALYGSTYTITNNLTNCTTSNSATTVENGDSYTTTLTADTNYTLNTVTVTMGGSDITSSVYTSGTISIPSVTGNIVITASAVLAAESITATYTQSGAVYDTASLSDLTSDLVVTATYSDSSTAIVSSSDYVLSGTLTIGTSTITVTYAGLTDTFDVTVTAEPVTTVQITEVGTLIRENAYGANNTNTSSSFSNCVYSITNVRSGDVFILPSGWNSATWESAKMISTTGTSTSIPDITLGDTWVQNGRSYGYYPITINEDLDILYVAFSQNWTDVATWTRESGF